MRKGRKIWMRRVNIIIYFGTQVAKLSCEFSGCFVSAQAMRLLTIPYCLEYQHIHDFMKTLAVQHGLVLWDLGCLRTVFFTAMSPRAPSVDEYWIAFAVTRHRDETLVLSPETSSDSHSCLNVNIHGCLCSHWEYVKSIIPHMSESHIHGHMRVLCTEDWHCCKV